MSEETNSTGVLSQLEESGIDITTLAHEAGISGADIDALSQEDMKALIRCVQEKHPEALPAVTSRFPGAEGLLSTMGDNGETDGVLGSFLGGE